MSDSSATAPDSPPLPLSAPVLGDDGGGGGNGDDDEEPRGYYELEERPEVVAQEEAAAEAAEEEDAEDLVGDGMERDYAPEPELDRYDPEMLDHRAYAPPTAGQRAAAEAELRERDRARILEGRGGQTALDRARWLQRVPAVLLADEADELEGIPLRGTAATADASAADELSAAAATAERPAPAKRRRMLYEEVSEGEGDGLLEGVGDVEDEEDVAVSAMVDAELDHAEGNLQELLALESTRREVARRFRNFLLTFTAPSASGSGGNVAVYKRRISAMCAANRESLPVNFGDLSNAQPTLSTWVTEEPGMMLPIFDEAATHVTLRLFPEYKRIASSIHVRITDLPIADSVRDLRQYHLNHLIKVVGVVTRRTSVFPQLVSIKYDCSSCGCIIGPFTTSDTNAQPPQIAACPNCHGRGPFRLNTEQTLFRNYQKITLQESPGSVPPGRLPRSKEVVLLYDLIDSSKPGEEIEVIGIYRHSYDMALNHSHGFPVFSTIIEANNVIRRDDMLASFKLTEDDEQRIRRLAAEENILERITASIAPSICGHTDVKLAIALALFGGETHVLRSKGQHRIRGDINVLLLGDPGTAKSQFLKFVEKTSHRAIFTTGKGSTAVGLTAAVHKDPMTKEWTLEGGALVLADRGICLIDEFDKMNDQDRTSIHEAMEQQSISISKAGIVTTLQARCSVIAAANPVKGRYNPSLPFKDNVELTEPILSRFDIILVIVDKVDPVQDRNLARFVVQSHVISHPYHRALRRQLGPVAAAAVDVDDANLIPQDLLRKYIMYARTHVRPQWVYNTELQKLESIYIGLRQASRPNSGVQICTRHVESAMRMAEACARLHLRDQVRDSDMCLAVRVMLESFIGTQKEPVAKALSRQFRQHLSYGKDDNYLLCHLLLELVRQRCWLRQRGDDGDGDGDDATPRNPKVIEIDKEDFETIAAGMKITNCRPFYRSALFRNNGFRFNDEETKIIKDL